MKQGRYHLSPFTSARRRLDGRGKGGKVDRITSETRRPLMGRQQAGKRHHAGPYPTTTLNTTFIHLTPFRSGRATSFWKVVFGREGAISPFSLAISHSDRLSYPRGAA